MKTFVRSWTNRICILTISISTGRWVVFCVVDEYVVTESVLYQPLEGATS